MCVWEAFPSLSLSLFVVGPSPPPFGYIIYYGPVEDQKIDPISTTHFSLQNWNVFGDAVHRIHFVVTPGWTGWLSLFVSADPVQPSVPRASRGGNTRCDWIVCLTEATYPDPCSPERGSSSRGRSRSGPLTVYARRFVDREISIHYTYNYGF